MPLGNGGGGSGLNVLSATLHRSSAQILTLGTPVTIVPAQGAGTVIFPVHALFVLHAGGVAYGTNTQLQVKDGQGDIALASGATFLAQGSDTLAFDDSGVNLEGINVASASVINAPLTLSVGGGNPTGGTGNIDVTVHYFVVTP